MKKYCIKSIDESLIEVTGQKIITVIISEVKERKKDSNLNLQFFEELILLGKTGMPGIPLVLDAKCEYSSFLLSCFVDQSSITWDITQFLAIDQIVRDKKTKFYYHNSVDVKHLVGEVNRFFKIGARKENNALYFTFNEDVAPASIDIGLKDIYIFLKYSKNVSKIENNANEGYFNFEIYKYQRELSEQEKLEISIIRLPSHQVDFSCSGITYSEILKVLNQFQQDLPEYIKSRFHYNVNFLDLLLK